jgi:hypothetical protein
MNPENPDSKDYLDFTDLWIRDARVFSPTGFNVIFTRFHLDFESGFTGFTELQRTS